MTLLSALSQVIYDFVAIANQATQDLIFRNVFSSGKGRETVSFYI